MPSKKYTAQQRAELKRKKAKQAKKGTYSKEKNNRMLFSIIFIIKSLKKFDLLNIFINKSLSK